MSDISEIVLDADQARVAAASAHERLYVVAGPGSGKTEVVSARIAHLTEAEDVAGESLLVISFSRAAVEAVQRRQREHSPYSAAWVTTLDSLTSRMLTDAGIEVEGLGFDTRIKRLLTALRESPEVREQMEDVEHLIVDEVQDVVGLRADLLAALLEALPDSAGFTFLGDPLQGIYDFQQLPGSLTAEAVRARAVLLGAEVVELHGEYRAQTNDATIAMATRLNGAIRPWIHAMQIYVDAMPKLESSGLVEWIDRCTGTVAVLTQSNAQALLVARELYAAGIPAELLGPALNRPVAPWIAHDLGDAAATLDRDSFFGRMLEVGEETALERWLALRRLTRANGALDTVAVARRLAAGIVPPSLYAERRRVTVSTIHRAKGLEFDRVLLLHPDSWYATDDEDDYARSLYVAITRPRIRLLTLSAPKTAERWHADKRTQRATRSPWGKKGISGFEIRGSDWRTASPPDVDDEPERAQEILADLDPDGPPRAVEVRCNPYDSTSLRPCYDAYLDDRRVGTLGDEFLEDFIRRTGRCDKWPRLGGLFLVGAETVAGPVQHGPVGRNGLWLSPLIVGPAALDWRH